VIVFFIFVTITIVSVVYILMIFAILLIILIISSLKNSKYIFLYVELLLTTLYAPIVISVEISFNMLFCYIYFNLELFFCNNIIGGSIVNEKRFHI
jgi:hypothetical protein